jgi:hypothetical protein
MLWKEVKREEASRTLLEVREVRGNAEQKVCWWKRPKAGMHRQQEVLPKLLRLGQKYQQYETE